MMDSSTILARCPETSIRGKPPWSIIVLVELASEVWRKSRHFNDWKLDAAGFVRRRGADWTFDAAGFVQAVKNLRGSGKASVPSFDHAVGDPVPDAINVCEENRITLVEGNYLLLDIAPWNELRDIFDETWHITCNDLDVQMARVERRHMATGNSAELAAQRVNGNDRPNAELVEQHARHADVIITSIQI
ncbi:hypothetical protein CYMTET_26338 [Cymbomonas tetramitiformis]|uniref:Uncharacterized protein n=1 Tax=Cymbomonas tetramitiformis TaxID=36881 RepID=A0AAE0FTI6_9CHLO|nr:hypothetical protein CYMTET_26338 [Cymbomonas tetramitiformis]